jgi:L-threonylcarbamoyladenylate synthase
MQRLPFTLSEDLSAAVKAVRAAVAVHGVTALPTETFYGLAVDPRDDKAVARVFALKQRPAEKALPVVGASTEQLAGLVCIPPLWRRRLEEVWPAPLTVVLERAGGPGRFGSLAVRVPGHALLRRLLAEVGPLTATSANRSGGKALASGDAVAAAFGGGVAVLLDGGVTQGGLPSTIIDGTVAPARLVRRGAFEIPGEWGVTAG